VITLGIDLASQDKSTAVCEIEWAQSGADVREVRCKISDNEIKHSLENVTFIKIGIDIPLGWPDAFVEAITHHHADSGWPEVSMRQLRYRATDEFVNTELNTHVLSVSSDLIAIPTFRAARLIAGLGGPIDRSGKGRICEVYPAGALSRWNLPFRKYKGRNVEVRHRLVEQILSRTRDWLTLSTRDRTLCEQDDNALDALVSGLVARASCKGLVDGVPDHLKGRAAREGWIALPVANSLERLL